MIIRNLAFCSLLSFSFNSFATQSTTQSVDKQEILHGVQLTSSKADKVRTYVGAATKIFKRPIMTVKDGITNFSEKCNNDYKSKREYTDKDADCRFHNDHLVETVIIKNLNNSTPMEANEVERYVLGRKIYNRGSFGYYELVRVFESKNDKNQKVIKIVSSMMDDSEVEKLTSPKFKKDSPFNTTTSVYTLTEVTPEETSLDYRYTAQTEHWLLNKEVSVPQVFASISKSVNDFLDTVPSDKSSQNREVASKH